MFKLAACFWMALAVPATVYGEVEPSLDPLMVPDQYFAAEFRDDYYWRLLFPDDPPFAYACMYRPSFGREFGFYLDGDRLYWARAVGPCSAQMLSQSPMVKLQNMVEQYIPGLLSCLPFPISGKLVEEWNRMSEGWEEDPFSSGEENASDSFSQFWEGCMFAVDWVESTINSALYSRLFVKRGAIELTPSLAGALRKTWDEAITDRTFSMDLYRQYLAVCDGEYFYFRGASGPAGEDLCRGKGMMRSAMRDLAYGLIDMAMMDDLKPEGEQWMMEQCARICRYAAALGDEAPPMVFEAWVQDFLKRLAKQEERNGDQGKERKMNKSVPEDSAGTEEKTEEKSASSYSKTSYVRGFRKRFLRSLDRNPLWKDLFPAGTQGKPGVCWLGNRGISGFYLDGPLMGRAESESMAYTPLSVYNLWFFERKPEKPVFPYEGIPDGAGHMEPRVRREWLHTGEAVSRLMAEILTDIAREKMSAGEGEKREDIRFCVVRGIDGTERIMSSSDADLQAVVDLMDSLYTIDLLFNGDEDYLLWIFEKFAVLQGRRKVEKDEASARKAAWDASGRKREFRLDTGRGGRIMRLSMHADLEKLLSLGKITPALAEKLDRIAPGRYCSHASWGAGKVISWNLPAKKLVIDFEENPEHEVALEFAPKILEFINDDHFLARRYEDTESLINLSVDDPVELVRITLQGYGNSLTPEKLEAALKGTVIAADKWKSWWDKVRAMLRSNVQFMMPTRKGERITLRANILSRAQAALEDYNKAADLKARVRVLDGIKLEAVMTEPDVVNALVQAVDADVRNGGSLALQQVLELAVLRDDLIAALKSTEAAQAAYPLRDIVEANIGDVERFAEVLNSMPSVRQKRVYATLPAIFGEEWPQRALELFDAGGARAVGEIAKFLIDEGQGKVLVKHLKHELLRQALPPESLIWICRQRHDASKSVFGLPVGIAMLSLIEQNHMDGGPNRMLRLKNLLMEDKSIIQEMIKGQDVAEVRQFAKMLYNTSAFSEQDRGALMARVIGVFPDLHAIVLDALVDTSDKPEPIFVSWESLEARKKELEELVNVKIPENLHNKKISRAEGDLRENGGYQDAKEVEKVLNRRRAELEHALALARGTDFTVMDTSCAAMGTKVTLQPLDGGEPVVYTILGAWDTNPEKHIVSYLSQVGKELTGKSVGDQVKIVPMDGDKKKVFTIMKIEAAF